MKSFILAGILAAVALGANAKTNDQIISSMSDMDRMVACSMAHESWQYNAPNSKQAEQHRVKSAEVMNAAAKKYGAKAYMALASPEVMTFKMVALNRASISLEPKLCKGFGEKAEFTVSAPSDYKADADNSPLTLEQSGIRRKSKGFKEISQFYDYIATGETWGKTTESEALRLYMCFSAFATDSQGEKYQNELDRIMGVGTEGKGGVNEVEFAVSGIPLFDKFFEHAIGQYQGQFVDNYCQDF